MSAPIFGLYHVCRGHGIIFGTCGQDGEGESENASDEELVYIAARGEEYLDSNEVDEIGFFNFIILTDNEDFAMEDLL